MSSAALPVEFELFCDDLYRPRDDGPLGATTDLS